MSAGKAVPGVRRCVSTITAIVALSLALFALPAIAQAAPPEANDVFAGTNDVTPVVVNFSASDPDLDPITYSIVTGPSGGSLGAVNQTPPGSVTYTANPTFAGIDSFVYRATAGAEDADASATVIVRPNTAVDSGPSGLTNDDTPTFGFSSPQTGMVFECRIDAGTWAACTDPFTSTQLPDGTHTFYVRARAGLGGPVDSTPASSSFTVDATAPTVNLTQTVGQDDPTKMAPIEFSLISNEDLNGATVDASDFAVTNGSVAGITGGPTDFTIAATPTADGAVDIALSPTFSVSDTAGNAQTSASGADRTVTYDTTAPNVTLQQDNGQADPTNNASIAFAFTSNEDLDGASVEVADFTATPNGTVDSVSGSGQSFTVNVTATADGPVDIAPSGTFEVADIPGNTKGTAAGADRSVVYDSTPATVTLEQAVGQVDPTTSTSIEFTLSSDENLNAASVTSTDFSVSNGSVDGVSGSGNEFTVDVTAAAEGPVEISPSGTFSVSDIAGNAQTSAGGADRIVTHDLPPVLSLEQAGGQADPTNNPAIEFELSSNEDLNPATVGAPDFDVTNGTIDSVTGSTDAYTVAVTATADGDVVIAPSPTFSVEDLVANPQTSVGGTDRTVVYDSTPPITTIDTNPTDPSYDRTPSFEFSADEPVVGYECSLELQSDPSNFAACSSPYDSALLATGDYRFEVRATDLGGSTGGAATYSWTIEPSTVIAGAQIDPYYTRGGNPVSTTINASDTQPGAFTYTFQGSTQGGTLGSFTVNPGSGTASYTAADGFAGTDTVTVRVRNVATDAFTDTSFDVVVRPKTRLLSGPGVGLANPHTNDNTPTFSFDAVSGPGDGPVAGAGFACSLDDVPQPTIDCAGGTYTPAALDDGQHKFEVTASKPAINLDNVPQSVTFTVDTVNPGSPGLTGTHDLTNDNDLSYTVTLPEGTAECRLIAPGDPAPVWQTSGCDGEVAYTDVADGDYIFQVRTVDAAENRSPVSSLSATVDTVVDVSIDSAPSDGNADARPTIAFSSSENPDVTYTCRLFPATAAEVDKPAFAACSSPTQLPFLDQNIRLRFEVHVTDPAGNENVASVEWDQTNTAPVVPAPDVTVPAGDDVNVALGSTDADSDPLSYSIVTDPITGGTLGSINQGNGDVTFSAAGDAAGVYTFNFEVTDQRQGGTVGGTATVRVEPETTLLTEPPAETNNVRPTWTFESPSGGSTFECRLDATPPWFACDGGTYTPDSDLTEGSHVLEVRATSGALADQTPVTSQVMIDLTAPDVAIDTTPVALSNVAAPVFEFSSTDPTATFECSVDNGDWAACDSGDPIAALEDGLHNFRVRAVDPGTNAGTPASYDWEVDLTKPVIEFQAGPVEGDWVNARKPIFEFTEADLNLVPDSTVCSVDAQTPVTDCLSPWQPAFNLNDDQHTATFESSDAAGNTRSVSITFRVTTITPTVVIDSGPTSPSGPSASFAFSSTTNLGANGHFECRTSLNGGAYGAWATCPGNLQLTGLSSGNRTIQVRAVDSAGNYSTGGAVASWSWSTIGTTPDTVITNTAVNDAAAAFAFNSPGNPVANFECSLDGAAFAACGSPKSYSGLSVGAHDFAVRAVNAVGTKDASPATHNWSVTAGTAPNTSITRQPPARTTDTGATFEFASSDTNSTFECRLDGGAFEACGSPKVYSDLSLADHTFAVRATNFGGLTDQSPASVTWTVSDTQVDLTPAQLGKPVIKGWKRVKAGKPVSLRVSVKNTGQETAEPKVCVTATTEFIKGKAERCRTFTIAGKTTGAATFAIGTKLTKALKKLRKAKKGEELGKVKFRITAEYLSAGVLKRIGSGHVTVLK